MGKRKASTPRIAKTALVVNGSTSAYKSSIGKAGSIEKTANAPGGTGVGMGGVITGGAYPTSQTPTNFYSPELTVESFLLPKSRQEILKWCYRGGTMMQTPNGAKAIEDFLPGDIVLSATGLYQKVLATIKRPYSGEITTLKACYVPPITATSNHELQIIHSVPCKARAMKTACRPSCREWWPQNEHHQKDFKVEKTTFGEVTTYDYVLYPKLKATSSRSYINLKDFYTEDHSTSTTTTLIPFSEELFYFLGFYLAEGCVTSGGLSIAYGPKDFEYVEKLEPFLIKTFRVSHVRKTQLSNGGFNLAINSKVLSDSFRKMFGHESFNKYLPQFVMEAPKNYVRSFLQGYFQGDGHADANQASVWSTSPKIIHGIFQLFSKLDILPSYHETKKHKDCVINGRTVKQKHTLFQLKIQGFQLAKFEERSVVLRHRGEKFFEDAENFYIPVKSIEKEQYTGMVYNFETEDHTCVPGISNFQCRIFFNLEAYIQSIITMHADYPFSKFDILTEDPSVTEFYKDVAFSDTFDLYDFIRRASLSYWKFGEAIPFGNMEQDEDGKWRWNNFILLEPELVEVRQEIFEDAPHFELVPTEELKQVVKSSDPTALERQKGIPDVVKESIKNNRLIPLDSESVSLIGRITDPSATRGTPVIQSLFKILIYQDWIRLAQAAFAQRYVFPIELWQIGDAAQGIWPTTDELETFKNTISLAVQNPPFSLVFPPVVKYESLSTQGRSYFPVTNEYQYIHDQILVGLGVNKNLILGEGPSFSNVRTMALHKLMMVYKAVRDQFENWMIKNFFRPLAVKNDLFKVVNGRKKYILPTISWYKSLDLEERDLERKQYWEMWKAGVVSTETLFGKYSDLDYTTEALKLEKERGTVFDKADKRLPQGPIEAIQQGQPMPGLGGAPKEMHQPGEVSEVAPAAEAPQMPEMPSPPTPPEAPIAPNTSAI